MLGPSGYMSVTKDQSITQFCLIPGSHSLMPKIHSHAPTGSHSQDHIASFPAHFLYSTASVGAGNEPMVQSPQAN